MRGVNLLIQDGLKGKHYIVGIERVAVGELNSLAQFEFPMKPVVGHFPGFGEGGFGSHRLPVDMNQVRHQALQNLAGTRIGSHHPIEGFRLGSLRGNQASAGTSRGAGNEQTVIHRGVESPHQAEHAESLSQSVHQTSRTCPHGSLADCQRLRYLSKVLGCVTWEWGNCGSARQFSLTNPSVAW